MIPIAGSAYTYAYATLGEIIAWMIGWDLILEYAVGSMTVAIGWSGYFQRILAGFGVELPAWMAAAPGTAPGAVINLPAVVIVLGDHGAARDRDPRERALQRGDGRDQDRGGALLHRRRRPLREAGELVALRSLRLVRHHGRRRRRLLRLHRLRRGLHHRRGGEEPEARPPDRHHRLAGHLHHPVHRGGRDPERDRSRDELSHHRGRSRGHADRAARGEHPLPERPGRLRAARDRAGLGRRADLGGRRGRHHERAARDADEPAAHLLLDEPRPAAAPRRLGGAPALRHALHHHHHHRRGRRAGGGAHPDQRGGRDDVASGRSSPSSSCAPP